MTGTTKASAKDDLEGAKVLVVDCQTTGAAPPTGRLIEVGWALCTARDEPPVDPTSRLIKPGDPAVPLPRRVTKLTGIAGDDVSGAPTEEEVFAELDEVISREAPAIGVAHFARFEKSFLDDLYQRRRGADFPLPLACTHELALRLHPRLPRLTLRALCGYHGHFVPEKRRAAPHVAATVHLWRRLVPALRAEHGIEAIEGLWDFLSTPRPRRPKKKSYLLEDEERLSLPMSPGVYRFFGPEGTLLYVGKATNLRSRVSSYFTRSRGKGEHILEMVTMASRVEHEALGSPLEAALREQELISALDPPYNRALRPSPDRVFFASADFTRIGEMTADRGDLCYGPLTSRDSLDRFKDLCGAVAGDDEAALRLGAQLKAADAVTLAGRDLFVRRYLKALPTDLPRVAARLIAFGAMREEQRKLERAREKNDPKDSKTPETEEAPGVDDTTAEDVARFFASIARFAGREWRTACALRFLSHCTLAWRPSSLPRGAPGRLIVVHGGEISPCRPWHPGEDVPAPPGLGTPLDERRCLFEPSTRDRLRVLLAELARLCRGDFEVRLRLSSSTALRGPQIAELFAGGKP